MEASLIHDQYQFYTNFIFTHSLFFSVIYHFISLVSCNPCTMCLKVTKEN